MAKAQWPIDGKFGSTFRVTSPFGWRMHPVRKVKAHHNGVDLWGASETIYIESMFDGKVIFAGPSKKKNKDGSVGGFGYHVQVLFNFRGEWYVATFAHMKQGSIKVKAGQKIEAGTVLGIMGATGMVDGRHLHLEITKGKKYVWTDNGKGFIDPIEFIKAAIRFERINATAGEATPEDAPVAPAPTHDEAQATAVQAEYEAKKAKPAAAPKPVADPKSYTVKPGDSYWAIAVAHPVEGKTVEQCVKRLQDLNENKSLRPGDVLKLY
jgi:murein DD-endopeptidase MepM/ murein hydrolase activator NlpD